MIVSSFSCTLKYVCSTGFDRSALCLRSPYVRVRCRRWAQCRGHAAGYLGLVGCAPGQGWLPSFRVVCSSRTGLHLSPCYHVVSELGCSSHLPLPAFFYLPSSPAHWLALSRCYSLTRSLSPSLAIAYKHTRHGRRDRQLLPLPFPSLQAPSCPTTSTTSFTSPSFSRNRRVSGLCHAPPWPSHRRAPRFAPVCQPHARAQATAPCSSTSRA
jgi:hypothetical protein